MENWGLVTFRDTRLLVDPQNTSAATKQAIASTISHEVLTDMQCSKKNIPKLAS